MPPIDPDAPWWVNSLLVLVGIYGSAWLATRGTRKKVEETRGDVAAIKEQTNNSHSTNLREDIDKVSESARLAMESSHRTERHVADLTTSIRATEHSLDRRTNLQDRAIAELREDIPRVVSDAVDQHVTDCPLRQHKEKP